MPPRFSQMRGALFTPARADAFIEAIATGSEDKEAAEFAGVTLNAVRERSSRDSAFRAAYAEARKNRIEVYRSEARRRAVDGVLEPVWYRGEQVGVRRVYSDRLMEMLLRAEDPDTFGDRQVVTVLAAPLSAQDIMQAVAAGKMPGAVDALEAAAALFAQAAERGLEAPADAEVTEGEWEPA